MMLWRPAGLLALSCLTVLGFPVNPQVEEGESSTFSADSIDDEIMTVNDKSVQGNVRVVQVSPGALAESLLFRRVRADLPSPLVGLPSALHVGSPKMAFRPMPPPYFLPSRDAAPVQGFGVPGIFRPSVKVLPQPEVQQVEEKKSGPDMWRRAIQRGNQAETVLPLTHSDVSKSSCKAIPFTQTISRSNCTPVKVQNRFCFGQCSSFYVPGSLSGTGRPCSGCAPSRVRKITVPLHCGNELLAQEEEVTLVEECRCEAQGETDALRHLSSLSFQG